MKRTVVVTGGTKGLGREIAMTFGGAGYFVVALYASDETAAQELKTALAGIQASGCVLKHDVSSEDASIWSRPEIQDAESLTLIHNACAPFSPAPMHKLRWQDFETNFTVGVKGSWLCSQALIRPMLKKGGGAIVNILTSALEGAPPKGFAAYVTAKHALRGLTLALAAEYSQRGVRIFSASPGFMDTALTQQWDPRLQDAIRGVSRITQPKKAAARLLELIEDTTTAGQGEDYPV